VTNPPQPWTARDLPTLTEHQLSCLQKFLHFELPIESLRAALAPLITFQLNGPATHQFVHSPAGRPKNPVRVTLEDVNSAFRRARAGQITAQQLQQWATMIELNPAFDVHGDEALSYLLNAVGELPVP
jgi:hypothetical protein